MARTKQRLRAKAKVVSAISKATAAKAKVKATVKAKARAKAPRTPMIKKVAFTLLPVVDPIRARAFYETVLGFQRGLSSPDGTWTEYDLPHGGCIALFRHPSPEHRRAPGGGTLALEVADLDALNERLADAGVVYQGAMIHGPHCRMSNILDSEGNSLMLHQLNG